LSKHLIAGTAGHIDHGKSLLTRTLTGTDPDRLKEEKDRGITIELGFASLKLPGESLLGIVDVPGHEKFVRHMVAGAAGMDLVMLIIAADEGIMPQTREHLDICQMLGIEKGLVVLTKTDLAEPEWLEMVTEEVAEFTRETFLEGAPILPVSSLSGEGFPELTEALDRLVEEIEPRSPWGVFRLPVDRVFTMKGFGTVVTGTTISGRAEVGDTVQIYPGERTTRIRGLQVHGETRPDVEAGYRTAVNLQGVGKAEVHRGDIIAHQGELTPSYIMDVRLNLLPSAPKSLTSRTRVRIHLGTAEVLGRVHILEGNELKPGESGLAQVRFEKPAVALARDRFVIRSYSPSTTIGGGRIIDPEAVKFRQRNKTVIQKLLSLEKGSPGEAILAALLHSGYRGGSASSLAASLNMEADSVQDHLKELSASGDIRRVGEGLRDPLIHGRTFLDLKNRSVSLLEEFHQRNPLKSGLVLEELRSRLPGNLEPKILAALIENLVEEELITLEGKLVRLSSHKVKLDEKQQRIRERVESTIRNAGLSVPSPDEISRDLRVDQRLLNSLIGVMVDDGVLVKIHDDIYIHRRDMDSLLAKIRDHFTSHQDLTVGHFKEMTGLSRKYSIPILEHFDRSGITLRAGDKRVLRQR
jgi:selenocysteine-specific elongation factor